MYNNFRLRENIASEEGKNLDNSRIRKDRSKIGI